MRRVFGLPSVFAPVAAVGAMLVPTNPADAQARTSGSVAIESSSSSTGANVILDVLSQTNIVLVVSGPAQAVTSVNIPQSLNAGTIGTADVRLPTVVTPLAGTGAVATPNAVAMSVGGNGPAPGGDGSTGQNDTMLIVIQYN